MSSAGRSLVVLPLPHAEAAAMRYAHRLGAPQVALASRRFADGETYLRVLGDVAGRDVAVVAELRNPNAQLPALLLLPDALRDLGAVSVGLIAPYLPYMRQDARFEPGEAVTARSFARLVSSAYEWLVTVDPHLHRIGSLDEVYTLRAAVVHSAPAIAAWLRAHVERPLIVGPDAESAQWVSEVAMLAGAPHTILRKTRRGDAEVEIDMDEPATAHRERTPVLVDDIISTGGTLSEAVRVLIGHGCARPVCIGVHAIFVGDAEAKLHAAGARRIVTCDTLTHSSNAIALADRVVESVRLVGIAAESGGPLHGAASGR